MSISKNILGITPAMQSIALVSSTSKMIKKPKKKKKMLKELIKGTTRILVGIPLIKETAGAIKGMS